MSELKNCQLCGSPIPQTGELAGRCPHCMLGLFFDSWDGRAEPSESASTGSGDQSPASLSRSGTIGRYRILRMIGEGGMGSVYEAEQDQPRRTVALKIIRPTIASPELLRRFEQESQALGRLQHPGIAQIYEAGTVDTGFGPQPYFAMEFVRGRSPREYAEAHNLTTRDRLELMAKTCDGVHHAHLRGLIHRDLKPGNILVDDTGQPKILDFGVARVTDSDTRATLQTDMGQLVGTLAYMSPEQALADPLDIDIRTDVYALGVILYELLSGQLPYAISKKIHESIQTIREQDPLRLSAVNRSYRGDIETIVARALEKDRARRYASAAEMAADIRRHLNDEPILARRPNAGYQMQKFARRNKALVAGTAGVFLVLIVGVITTSWLLARTRVERDRAVRAESLANKNEQEAAQARVDEREQRNIAVAAQTQAEAQTVRVQETLSQALVNLYHSNIESADREGLASNVQNADRLLEEAPVPLRNWEWHYLARRNHMEVALIAGHRDAILAMALSPDGKQLRTVSADSTVKLWDLDTRKEISTETFGGTASDVALGNNVGILFSRFAAETGPASFAVDQQFLDLVSGRRLKSLLLRFHFEPPIGGVGWSQVLPEPFALSPNGSRAAGAYDMEPSPTITLRCWDAGTGVDLFKLVEPAYPISQLAFSPDESMLAVIGKGAVKILDARTGQKLVEFGNSQDSFTLGAFSQDGRTFVAGILNEGLRAWAIPDGQEKWSNLVGNITSIAWSPDSRSIATAGADQTIRLLDSIRGLETTRLFGHVGAIRDLTFTRSGAQLLSVGDDKLVHLWSLRQQQPPLILDVGRSERLATVSPDGKNLLTATKTGMKLWSTTTGLVESELEVGEKSCWEMGFSRGSEPFVVRSTVNDMCGALGVVPEYLDGRGQVVLIDVRSGREIAVFDDLGVYPNFPGFVPVFWVSPNGRRTALVSSLLGQFVIQIREAGVGNRGINFRVDKGVTWGSQFSPDGKLAAVGIQSMKASKFEALEIWDTTTSYRLHRLDVGNYEMALFSQVGNQLAVVEPGRTISIWNAVTGKKLASTREVGKSGTGIAGLAYSPDGTRLASVSSDGEIWLWDSKTGKRLIPLKNSSGPYDVHETTVMWRRASSLWPFWTKRSLSFSQDGRRITLSTVVGEMERLSIRVETWNGTPRER